MSGLRRIRHAKLACVRDEHAWRGRVLLEDAMRTASLGDEGRLLVVRRLDLGRIGPGAGAQKWSLRCEERFRRLCEFAVSAESPVAASSVVVFFRDVSAVWVALAVRAARGVVCGEWFWSAARGWSPEMTSAETQRLCFSELVNIGGIAATVRLGEALISYGSIVDFLEALERNEVAGVLPRARECGVAIALPELWRREIARAVTRWHPTDPRVRWIAVVAVLTMSSGLHVEAAVQAADATLREISVRLFATQEGVRFNESSEFAHRDEREPSGQCGDVVSRKETGRDGRAQAIAISPDEAERKDLSPDARAELSVTKEATDEDFERGVFTKCGGLFFLVPLFARLGASEMPLGTAWLGLRLALERSRRGEDDALSGMLPQVSADDVGAEFSLKWPDEAVRAMTWREWTVMLDKTGRLPLRAVSPGDHLLPRWPDTIHPAAAALALGAHRLCRRLTKLGLRALVRRPARVAVTRTHVDVFMSLANVDTRIRRAALDADPGWVPWLGRAIFFHYTLDDR